MAEQIQIQANASDKAAVYSELIPQIEGLIQGETDEIAAMANVAAALHQAFGHHWIGFYRVRGAELVLGPFQGPVACTRIGLGKGVCGAAWQQASTLIVEDVDTFPGHIACSALSKSEIVVPVIDQHGTVRAVLDIDSEHFATFNALDKSGLERVVHTLAAQVYR